MTGAQPPDAPPPAPRLRSRAWFRILWTGLGLWLLAVGTTFLTENSNLIPTIVLLGSFTVPVTFVAWAFDRSRGENHLTVELLLTAFLVGGVLGVLGASVLETYLVHPSIGMYLLVGLIEEGVKLLALWLVARRLARFYIIDGIVLGAAVGFGFAAFESSGYALAALFTVDGLSLGDLVATEILRGILAPLGHGLWTAILGGLLFATARRSRGSRPRVDGPLVLGYLGVSLLHALWDAMHGLAVGLALLFTGARWEWDLLISGYDPEITDTQATLITVNQAVGLVAISLVALAWLGRERLRARRIDSLPWDDDGPSSEDDGRGGAAPGAGADAGAGVDPLDRI